MGVMGDMGLMGVTGSEIKIISAEITKIISEQNKKISTLF